MKQRILVMGKRGGVLQWYEHLLAAGEQLPNIEFKGFALNHNDFFERAKRSFSSLVNKANIDKINARALNKVLLNFQPDLIIIADLFYLSDDVLSVLDKYKHIKIAHWIGDFFDERLLRSRELVDCFYFTDTGLLQNAKKMGLENSLYLPLAFNPKVFKRPDKEARKNDLLFVGAWSENREAIIRNIEIPMIVIGKGWERIKDIQHRVISRNISNQEVAVLYQQHACVLNIINSNNINNGLNMRCFEVPACGALLITDNVTDLKNCYHQEEVITYSATDELSSLYRTLISKPADVVRISKNGNKRALSDHTYASRIMTVNSTIYN